MQDRDPAEIISIYQSVFEKCPLLSGFTSLEMHVLLRRVTFENFAPGAEILTEGNQYHSVWVLLRGTCEVVKQGIQKESRLATLEAGNIFGEMSFLHPVPHSASVRAIDQVETMRILREDYDDLSVSSPATSRKIAENIIWVVSDRLRKMDIYTAELVEKDGNVQRHKEWAEFRAKLYSNLFE